MKYPIFPAAIAFLLFQFTPLSARADSIQEKLLQKLEAMEVELKTLRSQVETLQAERKADQETLKTQTAVAPAPVSASSSTDLAASTTTASTVPEDLKVASAQPQRPMTNLNSELDPGLFGITYRSSEALRFGAYGEVKFGGLDGDNGWQNGFDATRAVLLGTYSINDWITFNSEIEFEHGGIGKDADEKLTGAIEVEQIFVDFKFSDYFNWRAPGVDVVPVGFSNLFHEPTQYYSVDRPELYRNLIPSTWYEGATSVYGKVVDNLTYQFQVSTSLEDAGTLGDGAGSSVPAEGYDPGIDGGSGLRHSRATISDRKQLGSELGYAARVAYTPPFIPGLAGSTSVYYTQNTSPRGAFGIRPDGSSFNLGKSSLTLFDSEIRYRVPTTGLELRAEYVQAFIGDSKNLRANNDGDAENNVGDDMYGYSFEAAYHLNLASYIANGWEVVPFYRFTRQNLQTGGFEGFDANAPTGAGDQNYHTFGVSVFPTPKLVLKLDYRLALDDAPDSPNSNHLFGAVGFFF